MRLNIIIFQAVTPESELHYLASSKPGYIKRKVTPEVLSMIFATVVMLIIFSIGFGCLFSLKTPPQFVDKVLAMNKEY